MDVHVFKFGRYQMFLFGICLSGCITTPKGDMGLLTVVLFSLFVMAAPGVAWESLFLCSNRISFNISGALIQTIARIFVLLGAVFLLVEVEESRVGQLFALYSYMAGMLVGVRLERRYPDTRRLCRDIVSAHSPSIVDRILRHYSKSTESEYAYPVVELTTGIATLLLANLARDEGASSRFTLKLGPICVLLTCRTSVCVTVDGGEVGSNAASPSRLRLLRTYWFLSEKVLQGFGTWTCDAGEYRFVKNSTSFRVTCFSRDAENRIKSFLREERN